MTDRYLDGTLGADSGTAETPPGWLTATYAQTAKDVNDLVIIANDTYNSVGNYNFVEGSIWRASAGATFTSDSSSYTGRISGSLPSSAILTFEGITWDGTGAGDAFEIATSTSLTRAITFTDNVFSGSTTQAFDHVARQGTTIFNNCDFNIANGTRCFSSTGIGLTLPMELEFNGGSFVNNRASGNSTAIKLGPTGTQVAGSSNLIDGTSFVVSGDGDVAGILATSTRDATVKNITSMAVTNNPVETTRFIHFQESSAGNPFLNTLVEDCDFDCLLPGTGYGISFGNATVAGAGSTATIRNVTLTGLPAASITGTPHNFSLSRGVGVTASNLVSNLGYVGILFGLSSGADVAVLDGFTVTDAKGPFLYAKGCDGGSASNGTCYSSGAHQQAANAILSAVIQGSTNTADFLYDNNNIYVSDIAKIQALSEYGSGQVATWTNNTYYLPSDQGIDLGAELLFGMSSTTANSTAAQWTAVYGTDTIDATTYTKAEIDAIIAGTPIATSPKLTTPYSIGSPELYGPNSMWYESTARTSSNITSYDFSSEFKDPFRIGDLLWARLNDGIFTLRFISTTKVEVL